MMNERVEVGFFSVQPVSEQYAALAADTEGFLNFLWEDLSPTERAQIFTGALRDAINGNRKGATMSDRADRMIQTLNATNVKGGPFIPDVKLEALLRVVAGEIDELEGRSAGKQHGEAKPAKPEASEDVAAKARKK